MSEKVRFSDFFYLIAATSRNPYALETTYDWFIENWDATKKRISGHSTVLLRRLLKIIIPVGAINKTDEALKFLNQNKIMGLERTYDQVLEELRVNSKFVKKYK